MKSTTDKNLECDMRAGIYCVLSGEWNRCEVKHICPEMVDKYMKSLGYERGEIESNGWQWDVWVPYTKDGKSFTSFVRGWYGTWEFTPTEA